MSSENKIPDPKTAISLLERYNDVTFVLMIVNAVAAADLFLSYNLGKNLLTFDWTFGVQGLGVGWVVLFFVSLLLLFSVGSSVIVALGEYVWRLLPERDMPTGGGPDPWNVTPRQLEEHALAEKDALLLSLVVKAREEDDARRRDHQRRLSVTALAWPLLFAELYMPGTVVNGAPTFVQLICGVLAIGSFMLFMDLMELSQYRPTQIFYPPLARLYRQRWENQRGS
ncbi:hypothetical protein [Lysobacter antibioticus]|uniref:hypothetical protein n=1 Tax=Lysobacter antibioticus TaxID=84531 RepID=UPI00113FF3D1|nr:hypothetical protein [Lysobacter antibioticus]